MFSEKTRPSVHEKRARFLAPFVCFEATSAAELGRVHLFTRGIGSGTDTLYPQLEVVRVGGVFECYFVSDQALLKKIIERLIKTLHDIVCAAQRDRIMHLQRLFRPNNALA